MNKNPALYYLPILKFLTPERIELWRFEKWKQRWEASFPTSFWILAKAHCQEHPFLLKMGFQSNLNLWVQSWKNRLTTSTIRDYHLPTSPIISVPICKRWFEISWDDKCSAAGRTTLTDADWRWVGRELGWPVGKAPSNKKDIETKKHRENGYMFQTCFYNVA